MKTLVAGHSPTRWIRDTLSQRHTRQLGTLGGGNHFVELVYDEEAKRNEMNSETLRLYTFEVCSFSA